MNGIRSHCFLQLWQFKLCFQLEFSEWAKKYNLAQHYTSRNPHALYSHGLSWSSDGPTLCSQCKAKQLTGQAKIICGICNAHLDLNKKKPISVYPQLAGIHRQHKSVYLLDWIYNTCMQI